MWEVEVISRWSLLCSSEGSAQGVSRYWLQLITEVVTDRKGWSEKVTGLFLLTYFLRDGLFITLHKLLWKLTTHPGPDFNKSLSEQLLKLWHRVIITSSSLTLERLDHFFSKPFFSNVVHYKCNIIISNWANTMSVQSTFWILMAWCFSTRASVATVLTMHPCVSRYLRVKQLTWPIECY